MLLSSCSQDCSQQAQGEALLMSVSSSAAKMSNLTIILIQRSLTPLQRPNTKIRELPDVSIEDISISDTESHVMTAGVV
eukprot:5743688-Amphidinium_carterae.1